MASRLWRISLTSEGGDRLTPDTPPQECNDGDNIVVQASINAIYECENKQQLTKYLHASLGSHPKATLVAAAKSNYLRGCPGLTDGAISKFIGVETADGPHETGAKGHTIDDYQKQTRTTIQRKGGTRIRRGDVGNA